MFALYLLIIQLDLLPTSTYIALPVHTCIVIRLHVLVYMYMYIYYYHIHLSIGVSVDSHYSFTHDSWFTHYVMYVYTHDLLRKPVPISTIMYTCTLYMCTCMRYMFVFASLVQWNFLHSVYGCNWINSYCISY